MTDSDKLFTDGQMYERLMGRWSRVVAEDFLNWVDAPKNRRWLDVGCGNGAFTEELIARCAPAAVTAVDPSEDQLDYARTRPGARMADFRVGDAQKLPFPDHSFDAMALVISFLSDPGRAVGEMARVVRPGRSVAAYMWDVPGGGVPVHPIFLAMESMGFMSGRPPNPKPSERNAMQALWEDAGLESTETRVIRIPTVYSDFDDFWDSCCADRAPGQNYCGHASRHPRGITLSTSRSPACLPGWPYHLRGVRERREGPRPGLIEFANAPPPKSVLSGMSMRRPCGQKPTSGVHNSAASVNAGTCILPTRLISAIISIEGAVPMDDAIIPHLRSIGKLAVLVILACLVGSLDVFGQQINPSPPLGASAPGAQRATKAKPQTDRASSAQRPRPKAVIREVARRISVGGGVLVLPEVAYYGVPVILDVPGLGFVEVSEDEYARLYKQLSSSRQEQVDSAIASLRAVKAAEDAEIEAAQNAPRSGPGEVERDLSEPISFGRPSRVTEPSRR